MQRVFNDVTMKLLLASSGKRARRELEDVSNVRAGVGAETSSKEAVVDVQLD